MKGATVNITISAGEVSLPAELNDSPELVNNDPYGDGWMVKVTLSDAAQVAGLLDAEAYQALVGA